ncbi:hypothetical protein QQS21_005831 [Conoideocrella luteorostrata]|uniref:Peptidase S8/S53 domain-containing protein n=1 Tax=Conoideocrella luteorostrata TaxID=1105319 RepID=A0AAJ0CP18_9HYPO|nr:hypothetical protein QQS21_005831 [Conoideocrella luteorostrata]
MPPGVANRQAVRRSEHSENASDVKFVADNVKSNESDVADIYEPARSPPRGRPGRHHSVTGSKTALVQRNAPWNHARVSHRRRDSNVCIYDEAAGRGTCVYVLDSGIDAEHDVSFSPTPQIPRNKYVAVTNGRGATSTSHLLASIEHVLYEAQYRSTRGPKGVVVKISLAIPYSSAVNLAVRRLVGQGCFVVAAAGNDASEVSESPATE